MPLHFSLQLFATSTITTSRISATKSKCQEDCHSVDRLVGPTRPWHAADDMGNEVNLTRPYPYFSLAHNNHSLVGELEPNTFSKFCELGCSLFHSTKREPTLLSDCTDSCDNVYQYDVTVGYNDLAEMARLECRDGCQIALKRCESGHYCTQVHVQDKSNETTRTADAADSNVNASSTTNTYSGGIMYQCPPGTFRDVSYDAVEECIACPLNHFRQKSKGENRESCTKCPINTYTTHVGSSSQTDCLRCPAGTFNTQPGSPCECITPGACKAEQLPSPADAEKRNTVPFIGRW